VHPKLTTRQPRHHVYHPASSLVTRQRPQASHRAYLALRRSGPLPAAHHLCSLQQQA